MKPPRGPARGCFTCQVLEHRILGVVCNDFERRALEINEKKHRQKFDTANSGLSFPAYLIGDIEDCP